MNKDLTVGEPQKVLWAFCLPLFGSVIFQQLYNIADSLVAGKFIGERALAAVGNSYEITLIFIAFAFGCNIGCSVIVSQLFGAKRHREIKTAIFTAFIMTAAILLVLMSSGIYFSKDLLLLINTPDDILQSSKLYLDIYIWGLPFLFFYNMSTGIFSALGDSRTPFIFLSVSSVLNILVDILFVAYFKMGVAGVAWATFLCQGLSAVLAVTVVMKRIKAFSHDKTAAYFSWELLASLLKIALPSTAQQSFISIGNIMIQAIINSYGSAVIAGYAAAIKLNNMVITSFSTTANGISNYTAQNDGALKTERIEQGHKAGLRILWLICIPFALIYFCFGRHLVSFFMADGSAEAISTGVTFLRIVAPFYFVAAFKLISDGVLRGLGAMKRFMAATFVDLVLRVVLAYLLSSLLQSSIGIWLGWPIGWGVAALMSYYFYRLSYQERLNNHDYL